MRIRKPTTHAPAEITPQHAYHRDARRHALGTPGRLGTLASAAGLASLFGVRTAAFAQPADRRARPPECLRG